MREIKFRVWTGNDTMLQVHSLGDNRLDDCLNFYVSGKEYPLMQFTGLKDKNGKEIYEGDIVETLFNEKLQIVFYEGSFHLAWKGGGISALVRNFTIPMQIKVIGNIYENPELLEKE